MMTEQTTNIQLNTSVISNVPLQNYYDEFTFIINGQHFKTSKLISNLLSPNICKIHKTDPTFSTFIINTKEKGNFKRILELVTFDKIQIPLNEISFIIEVINILGNDSIELLDKINLTPITKSNVFSLIKKHEKHDKFYSKEFCEEIDFIASNFFYFCEKQPE